MPGWFVPADEGCRSCYRAVWLPSRWQSSARSEPGGSGWRSFQ